MRELLYPAMRDELIGYLKELSSYDFQISNWGSNTKGKSSLDYSVHFLFDDTPLSRDASLSIGILLRDDIEAALISKVSCALEAIFQKYGQNLTDLEYLKKPEWVDVLTTSKTALNALASS